MHQFRQSLIAALETSLRLPPHEIAWFVERLIVFFSSCDARRFGQWEGMSWFDYVSAGRFSEDYRRMLVSSVTRFLLGSKADEAGARTLGLLWEQGVYAFMGRAPNGEYDQVLSLPTNAAWINPWMRELRRMGVRFVRPAVVERLSVHGGQVVSATVRHRGGSRARVEADWFVLAVPVERARRMLGRRRLLALDPSFEGLRSLETRWMNGIQFYLRRPTPIVRGHVLFIDSPWALTSISQAQFWPARDFPRFYGRGTVRECLSAVIGAFDTPGIVYGRTARSLRFRRQVAREVWEQMKASLNDRGRVVLRDEDVVRWYLDPGLVYRRGDGPRVRNRDPLFISTPGCWADRPSARTGVPNLFLAADYVRVGIDTATMEGACEAGRRAANGVLDAADSPAPSVRVNALYRPPEWDPLRRADEVAWRRGQRNAFDLPVPFGVRSAAG